MQTEQVLVMGGQQFTNTLVNKVSHRTDVQFLSNTVDLDTPRVLNGELAALKQPMEKASVVFCSCESFQLPAVEMALRSSKNVVLFGAHHLGEIELQNLLELALEAKSLLINGDVLFFNPVIYPNIGYFENAQFTKLKSNRFNQQLTRRSLFYCVEMLLWKMRSPVKSVSSKGVRLGGKYMNMIHARIEFENDSVALLEIGNIEKESILAVETVGNDAWLSLDLLTLNGTVHRLEAEEDDIRKVHPEKIYPAHRKPMNNLFLYIKEGLPNVGNQHAQFENSIQSARILGQIEDQLKRGFSEFTYFGD